MGVLNAKSAQTEVYATRTGAPCDASGSPDLKWEAALNVTSAASASTFAILGVDLSGD